MEITVVATNQQGQEEQVKLKYDACLQVYLTMDQMFLTQDIESRLEEEYTQHIADITEEMKKEMLAAYEQALPNFLDWTDAADYAIEKILQR